MTSCPVRLAFQDGEPESLFEPSYLLEVLKEILPRFGQPDDIQTWMNGENPSGYATGVMASSIILTSVLAVWAMLLLLCARVGPTRVGWLSGKVWLRDPPLPPPIPLQATAASLPSGPAHDSSGQSLTTAKRANGELAAMSYIPTGNAALHDNTMMDSSLPSMSTLQSMFVEDEEKNQSTPPRDLGPPLPSSPPLLSSSPIEQSHNHANVVELSALTTPDPYPLSSASSVASTTSEKYADYLKYLDDAVNPPNLISSPQDDDTMDSDDWLLEDVLADEPTFWTSDLPLPPATPTMETELPTESPTLLRSRPDTLDTSFPDGGEDGFLFDEEENKPVEPSVMVPPPIEPDTPTSLPRSNFASQAAARKRLLESFAQSRKRSPPINALLVTDDSTMISDVEHALLIRPEPVAKVYDDDNDDDDVMGEQAEDPADSSKDESISDLVDDLLAQALAPSLDEFESPEPVTRGYDLDETPMDYSDFQQVDSIQNAYKRTVIQRAPRETNSTQPTERSLSSHDDEAGMNVSALPSSQEEEKAMAEFNKAHALWLQQRRQSVQQLNRLRGAVVLVATFLVIGTLLGALNGAWALDWNRQAIVDAWSGIQATAMELKDFVLELRTLQSSIRQQLWNLWQLLDQHCPLVRNSVCPLAYLPAAENVTCNLTGVPLQDSWNNWLDTFVSPETIEETLFQPEDWESFTMDVEALLGQPVERSLDGWNWALWAAVACNCLLSIFALSILAAISLDGATRLHYQLSTWSFATMYWITLILAWIFGMCYLIGTTLAVDTCTATLEEGVSAPSETVQILLDRIETRSFLPNYWEYLVQGCPSETYPEFLSDRVWEWGNFLPTTIGIANGLLEFSDDKFMQTCGTPIGPLRSAAETFSLQLCMVTQSLVNIRRNLGCDQWYPWYESLANESICNQGSTAFVWSRYVLYG